MNLPVPGVGQTVGPTYASDVNTSLNMIDSHTHAPGSGVPITPSGLNINSDLPMQSNNAVSVRTIRFAPQPSLISGSGADIGCLYESGVDLYYNDGSGNQVRITQSGGVAGSPGSISNLVAPASAAYVAVNSTFVWQSDSGIAANMDAGTLIIRYPGSYPTPSGNYIALQAPTGLATGYALTLPTTTPATLGSWMTSTTSGVLSWISADNASIEIASTLLRVKAQGILTSMMADANVTNLKMAVDSVGTTNIIDANVTNPKLATDSVSTIKIIDGNVTQPKLGPQNQGFGTLSGSPNTGGSWNTLASVTIDVSTSRTVLVSVRPPAAASYIFVPAANNLSFRFSLGSVGNFTYIHFPPGSWPVNQVVQIPTSGATAADTCFLEAQAVGVGPTYPAGTVMVVTQL